MNEIKKDDIRFLKGVGEKRAELLKQLGVTSVRALFSYYPRAYEDWSNPYTVAEAPFDIPCCIKAKVISPISENYIRKNMTIYKFIAEDSNGGTLYVSVFNNKFILNSVKQGGEYLFYGKADGNLIEKNMSSPIIRRVGYEKIRPIYRACEKFSSASMEKLIETALKGYDFPDILSEKVKSENELVDLSTAINEIHFPKSRKSLDAARKRLAFDELLTLQTALFYKKMRLTDKPGRVIPQDMTEEFLKSLPFSPTNAQRRVISECVADMRSGKVMNRLVQGDVGSGKTAVAAAVIYNTVKSGGQCAMMAPTEILAEQHSVTLKRFLSKFGIKVAFLTGSTKKKEKDAIKEALANGDIDVVVGTHALIQPDVVFNDLVLVITDEQHRFGVAQKTGLSSKGDNVHVLVMSATPIPRTLSLIIYGDLELSVLDELPLGRKPIKTYSVDGSYRKRIYAFIRKAIDAGRQVYIVCPLVEEGDTETDLMPAVEYTEKLSKNDFSDKTVALLHGKMKPSEKEKVMSDFASGKIDILVATTVIEVGVDVPNAAVMLIENADRFGLSQLHQLRGRIGRGAEESTCIMISDRPDDNERLKAICSTTDGFKIADKDLELRGPGDFIGKRQHGLPEMKIADLTTDMPLLRQASKTAMEILRDDPSLSKPENLGLRKEVAVMLRGATVYGYN